MAAREVFIDRGPKAPVAMVAKKLGVSTATLFQRTGSKQQLMLMAFQPEGTPITELDRGVQPGVPVREQLEPRAHRDQPVPGRRHLGFDDVARGLHRSEPAGADAVAHARASSPAG